MDKKLQRKGYIQVFIAGSLWGTIGLFVTILSQMGANGSLISLLRIVTACIIMFFVVLFQGKGLAAFKISKEVLLLTLLMGLFCQAVYNLCYANAIQIAGVSTAAILLYTAPVFVCIMARIFFKEPMTRTKFIALTVNVLGCALTVTGGNFGSVSFVFWGVAAGILSGFFYALSTIFSKLAANKAHPYVITFYAFFFGAIFLILFNRPWEFVGGTLSLPMIFVGTVYGFITTVLAYAFYMTALAKPLETSKIPVIASVETVVAAAIGAVVFSESMGIWKAFGVAMVFLSIVIMNRPAKTGKSSASQD